MSDTEVTETKKRGRPSSAAVADSKAKKRSHVEPPSKKSAAKMADAGPAAKRGRGRPKGTNKKNGSLVWKPKSGKKKGRPAAKKSKKQESSSEESSDEPSDDDEVDGDEEKAESAEADDDEA